MSDENSHRIVALRHPFYGNPLAQFLTQTGRFLRLLNCLWIWGLEYYPCTLVVCTQTATSLMFKFEPAYTPNSRVFYMCKIYPKVLSYKSNCISLPLE